MSSSGASASCTRKIFVARNARDRLQVGLAREDVEAVEHETDRRMLGAPHRLPGVAVIADVAAPCERLEADPHAALRRALAERMKVVGGAADAAEALRRHVGAHQQEVAAELRHQVELALGAGEVALAKLGRHALEVAERLKGDDVEAEIGGAAAHVAGRAVEREEIGLEDLDALEARRGDRLELFIEVAAQRDRCDRQFHDQALHRGRRGQRQIGPSADSRLPDDLAHRYHAAGSRAPQTVGLARHLRIGRSSPSGACLRAPQGGHHEAYHQARFVGRHRRRHLHPRRRPPRPGPGGRSQCSAQSLQDAGRLGPASDRPQVRRRRSRSRSTTATARASGCSTAAAPTTAATRP